MVNWFGRDETFFTKNVKQFTETEEEEQEEEEQ